jgi:hypothetical protein
MAIMPEESRPSRVSYAAFGFLAGLIASVVLWFFPLPVALFHWLFRSDLPFGDYMLRSIPFFLAIPFLGAAIGALVRRRDRSEG